VEAAQVLPGNRAVVHHIVVTSTTLPPETTLDAQGHVNLPPGTPRTVGGSVPGGFGSFTAAWEPGVDVPVAFGSEIADRISGTHLVFNIHYQANGRETRDKSRVGLWLQKNPVKYATTGPSVGVGSETFVYDGRELVGRYSAQVTQDILPPGVKTVPNIPAGADDYRLTQIFPVRQDLELFSIQPHMHVRGRSIKYTAVFPDGREEVLINVPHYDFNWQIVYEFAKRVTLPAGTTIRVEAAWDNSTKNRYNPRPDKEVLWGEQSWDEMLSPTVRGLVKLATPVTPTLPPQLAH